MYVFFKQPETADRLVDELFDEYGYIKNKKKDIEKDLT